MRSTRGRVLQALRRGAKTVPELATAMGLTDNAVRTHVSNLERDEMVARVGRRKDGVGQPAVLYGLTAEGEAFFPKAYEAVLDQTLAALSSEMGETGAEALLRTAGRRLAERMSPPAGKLTDRVEGARRILEPLGATLEIREAAAGPVLAGLGCPLAGVVRDRPEACKVLEAMLEELVGAPVVERCERGGRPRCVFQIVAPDEG